MESRERERKRRKRTLCSWYWTTGQVELLTWEPEGIEKWRACERQILTFTASEREQIKQLKDFLNRQARPLQHLWIFTRIGSLEEKDEPDIPPLGKLLLHKGKWLPATVYDGDRQFLEKLGLECGKEEYNRGYLWEAEGILCFCGKLRDGWLTRKTRISAHNEESLGIWFRQNRVYFEQQTGSELREVIIYDNGIFSKTELFQMSENVMRKGDEKGLPLGANWYRDSLEESCVNGFAQSEGISKKWGEELYAAHARSFAEKTMRMCCFLIVVVFLILISVACHYREASPMMAGKARYTKEINNLEKRWQKAEKANLRKSEPSSLKEFALLFNGVPEHVRVSEFEIFKRGRVIRLAGEYSDEKQFSTWLNVLNERKEEINVNHLKDYSESGKRFSLIIGKEVDIR